MSSVKENKKNYIDNFLANMHTKIMSYKVNNN